MYFFLVGDRCATLGRSMSIRSRSDAKCRTVSSRTERFPGNDNCLRFELKLQLSWIRKDCWECVRNLDKLNLVIVGYGGLVLAWRTVAYQEVRLQIGPLAKLGCERSIAENLLVYIVTISCYAKVLHGFRFTPIFNTAPAASKNNARFKSDSKIIILLLWILIHDTLCCMIDLCINSLFWSLIHNHHVFHSLLLSKSSDCRFYCDLIK